VAGDEADLVADLEAVGGARDAEPSVLVGGALVGGGGLVADEPRPRVEGKRLQPGVDGGAVLGRGLTIVAQTKRLGAPSRSILRP